MATIKQKKAVEALVGNGGNITDAMRQAGYSPATYNTPQKLTESDGFQQICEDVGLTDDFLTKALYEDIKGKPKKRKQELELAFKIKGRLKDTPGGGTTNNNLFIVGGDQAARIIRRAAARLAAGQGSPNRLPDSNQPEV